MLFFAAGCDRAGDAGSSSPALAETFAGAADALAAKTGRPGEKSEMPGPADPAVLAFQQQSERALASLGTDALPIKGFESFDQFCGKAVNIVGAYALAGTKGLAGAAQEQRMIANMEQHLDQLFSPLLFSAHCTAQHLPFLEGEFDPSDQRKAQAVEQVRDGVARQLGGLLEMAADPSLDTPRRRRIMELLAEDADEFAVGLNPAQRQQVVAAAQEVEGMLPQELRGQARQVASQVSQASCGKICSAP